MSAEPAPGAPGDREAAHFKLDNLAIARWQAGERIDEAINNLTIEAMTLGFEPAEATRIIRAQFELCNERQSEEQAIQRLASLEPLRYEGVRKSEAERMGLRTPVLDKAVAKLREARPAQALLVAAPPEPWPEPVEGAALLDEIVATLNRFLVLPTGAAPVIALWIVYSYLVECFDVATWLGFTSPRERCGKTRAFEIMSILVARPFPAVNATPSAFFRAVEKWHPTILIDEFDAFSGNEELRCVLNSGYRRETAYVPRTEKVGDNFEVKQFSTFAALAFAKIGPLRRTLADRTIPVRMKRRAKSERIERLRMRKLKPGAAELRRKLARWAADHAEALTQAWPALLDSLDDRAAEIAEPLLAVADEAGGAWPRTARDALLALFAERSAEDDSATTLLLGDLRDLFDREGADRLPSKTVCKELCDLEDRPWATWRHGQPLNPNGLGWLLRPFGIAPTTIRLADGTTPKGYRRDQFSDAFSRYLPDPTVSSRHNATTAGSVGETDDFQTATATSCGGSKNASKPLGHKDCGDVADENPGAGGGDGIPPPNGADDDGVEVVPD